MNQIPILIISQNSSRRRELVESLDVFNEFRVQVQAGVAGESVLNDPEIIDLVSFNYLNGREMLAGEAGCAVAHFRAYQRIVQMDSKWVLVLEDNSRINAFALAKIPAMLSRLDSVMETERIPIIIHLLMNNSHFIGKKIYADQKFFLYESLTVLRLAKAYLINREAALVAIRAGLPIKDVADWPHWVLKTKFLVCPYDVVYIDHALQSEIDPLNLRHDKSRIEQATKTNNILEKSRVIVKYLCGLEAIEYRKITGLNDYFQWKVRDRAFRYASKLLGSPDVLNPNVVILNVPILEFFLTRPKKHWVH